MTKLKADETIEPKVTMISIPQIKVKRQIPDIFRNTNLETFMFIVNNQNLKISKTEIAKRLGLTENKIKTSIDKLIDNGLIESLSESHSFERTLSYRLTEKGQDIAKEMT